MHSIITILCPPFCTSQGVNDFWESTQMGVLKPFEHRCKTNMKKYEGIRLQYSDLRTSTFMDPTDGEKPTYAIFASVPFETLRTQL